MLPVLLVLILILIFVSVLGVSKRKYPGSKSACMHIRVSFVCFSSLAWSLVWVLYWMDFWVVMCYGLDDGMDMDMDDGVAFGVLIIFIKIVNR